MKRLLTLIAVCAGLMAYAQSDRIILVEQFTQASCGPCASTNPIIFPLLDNNSDRAAVIAYQVSWPGYDPMHEHNPGEANSRVTYYGVQAVPGTAFNGDYNRNRSSLQTVTQSTINSASSIPSRFELDLQVDPYTNFQGLDIDLNIKAVNDISGALVAHVVVVEDEINFNRPPGSNGETHFRWVMKKMLPNSRGTEIDAEWTGGEESNLSFSYEFENFYDWKEAGVVAFIQDDNTKDVLQAVYWKPEFEPNQGDDVLVTGAAASGFLDAEVDIVCGGEAAPVVSIMNSGTTDLNSCVIEYSINGSQVMEYDWSGSLPTFETVDIQLPEISFPIQFIGEMNVDVKAPNGTEDLYPDNGKLFSEFLLAPNSTTEATFEIRPIIRPADLSFRIVNSQNDVILEDGPFTQRVAKSYDITLEEGECYSIEIINNYNSVNGTFSLRDVKGERVLSETIQGAGTHVVDFGTFSSIATDNISGLDDWSIWPNPANEVLNISTDMSESKDVELMILSPLGTVLSTDDVSGRSGISQTTVDVRSLLPGLYFIVLRSGDAVETKSFIKS